MNIENEYFSEKRLFSKKVKTLEEFEELNPLLGMTDEQIDARNRGIKSIEEDIDESLEILDEIKIELYDFIYNDGEVSKKTIESLLADITNDIFFKAGDDDYDLEVLQGKQEFLKSLL